jgi:hypothetical protein
MANRRRVVSFPLHRTLRSGRTLVCWYRVVNSRAGPRVLISDVFDGALRSVKLSKKERDELSKECLIAWKAN